MTRAGIVPSPFSERILRGTIDEEEETDAAGALAVDRINNASFSK